jgi:2-amino-4-hydroxy-6-hydroxymethyldihydropteridine diphosphokinase
MNSPRRMLPLSTTVWLALGSNQAGAWGSPGSSLVRALECLETFDVRVGASTPHFKTKAIGPKQPDFNNLVICVTCSMGPAALLRTLKQIERMAGRRPRGRWTARPLDIDIISFKGARLNWPKRGAGRLTLPHPEAHKRLFVLLPLVTISPNWHHSALNISGRRLMANLPPNQKRGVRVVQPGLPASGASAHT